MCGISWYHVSVSVCENVRENVCLLLFCEKEAVESSKRFLMDTFIEINNASEVLIDVFMKAHFVTKP